MYIFCFLLFFLSAGQRVLAEEVRIGFLPALTGPFADLGEDCRRGTEASVQAFANRLPKGTLISLVTGDSQADPKIAVSEFRRLVDFEKVLAVITMRSNVGMAINPISRSKKVPLLGMVGHHRFVPENEYAFQFWPSVSEEGGVLAEYLLRKGQREAGVITAEDEWNISFSAKFRDVFEKGGGRLLFDETVPSTESDIAPLLGKLRSRPLQALFVNLGLYPGAAAVRRIREQQIQIPLYSNFWIADDAAIRSAGAGRTDGVRFPESRLSYPKFLAAIGNQGSEKRISGMTLACFAAYAAIVSVFEQNPQIRTKQELHQALSRLEHIDIGDAEFALRGRRVFFELEMKQIVSGKVQAVE